MRIGLIAEGWTDIAVITNIVKGLTGLDSSVLKPIRPSDDYDETDLANRDPNSFSNWSLVKKECEDRSNIDMFFSLEGNNYIIIHLDTAEAHEFNITKPIKNASFCESLRQIVVEKIKDWMKNEYDDRTLYAVAIEEIEAWLLTIYKPDVDSSTAANPKKSLDFILGKKEINTTSNYLNYLQLSKPFTKWKDVERKHYLEYNCSLKKFSEEIISKISHQ